MQGGECGGGMEEGEEGCVEMGEEGVQGGGDKIKVHQWFKEKTWNHLLLESYGYWYRHN